MDRFGDHQVHRAVDAAPHEEVAGHRQHVLSAVALGGLGVVHLHMEIVRAVGAQQVRRVETEAPEGIAMAAQQLSIEVDLRGPADRVEF